MNVNLNEKELNLVAGGTEPHPPWASSNGEPKFEIGEIVWYRQTIFSKYTQWQITDRNYDEAFWYSLKQVGSNKTEWGIGEMNLYKNKP